MTPAARRELDSHRAPARGFSLAEVLVAAAISALVFVLALSMLEALMKQYLRAMRDARLQQSVRAAFHRIVADLRNAGLNFNPDGDPARQAEPIEGMWNTAIMVRIDEDMAQATEKLVPEASLAARGGTYKAVSIGNDEIIGYALGAPSGGGAALRFTADVSGTPRDGRQESVMIRHVPIPDQSPPFILYRLRVSRRGTTITRQPMADDIDSLSFTYYDREDRLLQAAGGEESSTGRRSRAAITAIGVRLVGMTRDPYTRRVRKFALQTRVTPRNAGRSGAVDRGPDGP